MSFAKRLGKEIELRASRSSGPGGQNVNKVNSKVTLKFDVTNSAELTVEERGIIAEKLKSVLTKEGILILSSQGSRSQVDNKQAVLLKFEKLLSKAFEKRKKRVATKPSKGAAQKRIKEKKQHSEKKKWRQKL